MNNNSQMKRNRRQNWALGLYVIFLGIVVAALVAWWTQDQAFAILAVATIASVVLVVWHPIKLLAVIQAALTGLSVVALFLPVWMHGSLMRASGPDRQLWQPKYEMISMVAMWATLVPWILFTIYHLLAVGWRVLRPKAEV
jgi:hypothetical protein